MSVNVTSQEITIYNLTKWLIYYIFIYIYQKKGNIKNKNHYKILIYVLLFLNKVKITILY